MAHSWSSRRLDVQAFAESAAVLDGSTPLTEYGRLCSLLPADDQRAIADRAVVWRAVGKVQVVQGGGAQPWLMLAASATIPLVCQRCLGAADILLSVNRVFRFVRDEMVAEAEDADAEEDLLVISHTFDLHALVEDELLLAIPAVPMHLQCPHPLDFGDADQSPSGGQKAAESPFAALAGWRAKKVN